MTRIKLTIGRKIYALVAIGFIGCALISALGIWQLSQSLQEQKRVELKHLVEAAVKLIQHEHEEATAGKQTMDEASVKAAHHLSAMRYGDNDYFVIQSKANGTIVMHPRTEMIGKDMHKMKAPDGRTMGAIIEDAVKERGFGYATYDFPKAGKDKPQPKLAYVQEFAPWQWMIVTGVYIDDLNAQVFAFVRNMLIIIAALTLVGGGISFAVARTIGPPIRKVADTMHQLAAGNVMMNVDYTDRRDEVGDVARGALVQGKPATHRRHQRRAAAARNKCSPAAPERHASTCGTHPLVGRQRGRSHANAVGISRPRNRRYDIINHPHARAH